MLVAGIIITIVAVLIDYKFGPRSITERGLFHRKMA